MKLLVWVRSLGSALRVGRAGNAVAGTAVGCAPVRAGVALCVGVALVAVVAVVAVVAGSASACVTAPGAAAARAVFLVDDFVDEAEAVRP
ncbi:hypothetical protein [Paraburkholderia kururiensis]|uniref:Uncharacterized protein n=1 Tax=Paraburkholderia kururiensis TaxID=984307 RepID=A0ABZ0WH69_9BURK|nr:hypothetical protein [Paraburkholderia kururiensis]WQD76681.1 hypothetical protein U0042_21710 [Paraburkholderia kururiensis]